MATYSSNRTTVFSPAEKIFTTLSDLSNLSALLGRIPEDSLSDDNRRMLENIKVSGNTITVEGGPTGSLSLELVETRNPDLIRFSGVGLPVKLDVIIRITPETQEESSIITEIDADIPAMLRPMIGGALQKAANQFAMMLAGIPYGRTGENA